MNLLTTIVLLFPSFSVYKTNEDESIFHEWFVKSTWEVVIMLLGRKTRFISFYNQP